MAEYDLQVAAWEVRTVMDIGGLPGDALPYGIEVAASNDDKMAINVERGTPAEEAPREPPWSPRAGFEVYRFDSPHQAANEYFAVAGEYAPSLLDIFWREARMPTFGSPPEGWIRLADAIGKSGTTGVLAAIVVGPHGTPAQLVFVLLGVTVMVRVVDPVLRALGLGLAERVEIALKPPRRRRRATARPTEVRTKWGPPSPDRIEPPPAS